MLKFSLRTLLILVFVIGLAIPATMTGIEYSRFLEARDRSLSRLNYRNVQQGQGIESAISKLNFRNRDDSIIAFAGLNFRANGYKHLVVDWVSSKSKADSLIITLKDGRHITHSLDEHEIDWDTDVYYHCVINLDRIRFADEDNIKFVSLGHKGRAISRTVEPVAWSMLW